MENLDEAVSGGRVTRSLRKRLTSVDSDASSRPGTPVQSKLSSISESPVPSLPLRMTRRNSITTPVKSVASKAKVGARATTPEVNSPARRSARKRSISVVEVEHSSPVVKETLKQPIFDTLAEEELSHSKSKSPQSSQQLSPQLQIKLHRSIKLEPNGAEESEVEIINCESEDDVEVQKKAKRKSRKLSIKEEVLELLDDDTDASVETKKIATPKIKKEKIQIKSPGRTPKSKETENRTEDIKQLNDSLKNSEAPEEVTKPEEVTPVQGEGTASDMNKKGFVITEVVTLQSITPTTMNKLVSSGTNDTSAISDKSPERTKSVAFNDSEDDQSVRSVYPKTPGLTKSKSYIDADSSRDKSYQSEKGSMESFKDAEGDRNELPESGKQNVSMDYHRAEAEAYDVDPLMPAYTPYKSKLMSHEQSSTPISCVTPNIDDNGEADENELSCSPDKFLRSGKNYGSSPTFSPKSSPKVLNKSANRATNGAEEMQNSLKETQQTPVESPKQVTIKSPKKSPPESPKQTPTKSPKETSVKSPKGTPVKKTPVQSPKETPIKSPKETLVKSPKLNLAKSPKNKSSQSGDEMVSSTVATPVEKSPSKVVEKEPLFAKSWSQGVSGTVNGGEKIDSIMAIIDLDKTPKNVAVEQKSPLQKTPTPRKRLSRYESEDEEIIGDDEHIDEEEEEELAADEVAHTKHAFMDDEAMEVDDDYASGDSMDEEERRELEENAIEEDGESIGSEDTEEDDHHGDDDEENGSFIVSDSERDDELLEYSDENEHLEEEKPNGKKPKNYKRIQVISSESESDVEIIEEKVNTKPENNSVEAEDTESISHDLALQVSKFIDEEFSDSELVGTQTPQTQSPNVRKSTSGLNAPKSSAKLNESSTGRKSLNVSKSKLVSTEAHNISAKHESLLHDADSNTSKLSESAMKLQYESESEATEDEHTAQQMNESRKEILNLNKSDRFNKTVHELDTEQQETTPETLEEKSPKRVSIAANKSSSVIDNKRKSLNRSNLERSMREAIATSSSEEEDNEQTSRKPLRKAPLSHSLQMQRDQVHESSSSDEEEEEAAEKEHSSADEAEKKVLPRKSLNTSQRQRHLVLAAHSSDDESSPRKPSVSLLGEVSASSSHDSDEPEEKAEKPTLKKSSAGLSVSFDQIKKKNNKEMVSGKVRHSFFTLDMNVNKYDNATEQQSSSSGPNESEKDDDDDDAAAGNESKAQSSSLNSTTDNAISNEEEQELQKLAEIQKLTHHHVYHSRRQSLAMPVVETSTAKKPKRKSFCPPSVEDVQHSQSFVDRINERKRELQLQNTKRKRLSKSFCGVAGGSLDTTDYEVCHLHKKSKVSKTDSESESEQASADAITSDSPPIIKTAANDDNNNIQRILGRCDEILEAANRAKLEAKQNYKKSHVKLPKKRKQSKKFKSESSENEENAIPLVSKKEIKRKEKTKLALKQALKASVGIILNVPGKKKQKPLLKIDDESLEAKRLPAQVLEAISIKEDAAPKKIKKVPSELPENPKPQQSKTFKTNAGAVIIAPLTPQKRKKSHITKFQHATGTVSVEPASPARKPNLNGFRESPLRPHTTGFKVRQILTAGQDKVPTLPVASSSSLRRDGKRKRIVEPTHTLPKPQWSQSGLFLEEELPTRAFVTSGTTEYHLSGLQGGSRKSKKMPSTIASTALNFKNSTMFRDDIPRENSHKLLQRKERRYVHTQF